MIARMSPTRVLRAPASRRTRDCFTSAVTRLFSSRSGEVSMFVMLNASEVWSPAKS